MKFPYTEDQVIRAINRFKHQNRGLCFAFDDNNWTNTGSYEVIPHFLRTLGGRSKDGWFWSCPPGYYEETPEKAAKGLEQRTTMLAFMLVWSNDPDFEV
jgi:hypothetical protein